MACLLDVHGSSPLMTTGDSRRRTLDHRARYGISIIALGTEGEPTYPSLTHVHVVRLLHKWGLLFLERLMEILHRRGLEYLEETTPVATMEDELDRDMARLFALNRLDLLTQPTLFLRLYHHRERIQDLILFSKDETWNYRVTGQSPKNQDHPRVDITNRGAWYVTSWIWMWRMRRIVMRVRSRIRSLADRFLLREEDSSIVLHLPLGMYRIDRIRGFDSEPHPVPRMRLSTILKRLAASDAEHEAPRIVFLHCCRNGAGAGGHQIVSRESLQTMMARLRLTS